MLGYPCLNRTLRDRSDPLRCNRSMQKKTYESRGLPYVSELARQNFADLHEILQWNLDHDIRFYRCTSELIPWNSQFELSALPDYDEIETLARRCGALIDETGMRLTFHPDYWCKLASEADDTVERAVTAVEYHADWLDLMGLDRSPYYGINVHIGATYGDKDATADRFCETIDRLSPGARERVTVENDDKPSLWSVPELTEQVSDRTGVPVVFDYHHHSFTDRGYTYREAFELAADTWGDVRPAVHYSEPERLGDPTARPQAHADSVAGVPEWLCERADVMLEAGAKERALLAVRDKSDEKSTGA
ncbi:UV DNA damage repair endonuclease UvsE [Natronomonas gomsonensis]|uniref:UV DNA damage repair endonuclease UvsE n=1 Tax=Natronomonas gomsonensis TaxID=1046043 RepID=UPI00227BAA83|nr:UV DNA damage repair endonuclease UvsE [Natronomonas gomsonensis]MCY4732980.1 UV DNA damage repair endonuclease UvsE [Natronomonas gomsonensis]